MADSSSVLQMPGQSAPGVGLSPNVDYGPSVTPSPQASGIGVAPSVPVSQQSPAPVSDAQPMMTRRGLADGKLAGMSGISKALTLMGEFGAGMNGRPSPLYSSIDAEQKMAQQAQQQKLNNLTILNETTNSMKNGLDLLQGATGNDRKTLATAYAAKLDAVDPGMGQTFTALADKPGMLQMLQGNAQYLPKAFQLQLQADPASAVKYLGTKDGQAMLQSAMEIPMLDSATHKGQLMLAHWQQLVPPEIVKEIGNPANLSTGDLIKINNAVKSNPNAQMQQFAIPDDQLQIGLQHDTFASALHLLDAKGTQSVMQNTAEKGTWGDPYTMNGAQVQKNSATGEIRTAVTRAPVVNVNNVSPVTLTENGKKAYADLALQGKLPPGFRGQAQNDKNTFLNDEGDKRYGAGGTGVSLAGDQATAAGTKAALAQNQKDLTAIRPYKDMLDTNANIAIDLAGKVLKTDASLANRPITWIEQNATNNPAVGEFMAQNHFVTTEAARVLNNPRLVGQMTDSAVKDMQSVVDGNAPLGTYTRVMQRIMKDGNNRVNAMQSEHDKLVGSYSGNSGSVPTFANEAAASAAGLKSGTKVIINGVSGTWH